MHYVIMLVVGIVVGAIARFLVPGAEHMGLVMTGILGIAGSYVGGLISSQVFKSADGQFHPAGFGFAIVGAFVLLFVAKHFLHI